MGIRPLIVRWAVRLALLALVAGVVRSFLLIRTLPPAVFKAAPPAPTKQDVELCRNLVVSASVGGDLLSVGRAFTRRMRRGPFFLAARELIVDRLDATLPDSYFHAPPADAAADRATPRVSSPADAAARRATGPLPLSALKGALQNGDGSLRDFLPAVAGLSIRGLRISRQGSGANIAPWLSASRASTARGGLRLENGWSVEKGVTNSWNEAFLALEPNLRLYHP